MARAAFSCRDCLRCNGPLGAGRDIDWLLILYTAGLWLLWVLVRPHCPQCRHVGWAHTRYDRGRPSPRTGLPRRRRASRA